MEGIKNFLDLLNNNWTNIVVIIGLAIAVYKKVYGFVKKTNDEKINFAKSQIKEVMLKLVTDAEVDYEGWSKAGALKRSQVVEEIFLMYPILNKVSSEENVIAWIDEMIDDALKVMREIIKENV